MTYEDEEYYEYILTVHSEKEATQKPWMKELYVWIDVTTDGYMNIRRGKELLTLAEWRSIKRRGYFIR